MNKKLSDYFIDDEKISNHQCPICNSLLKNIIINYNFEYDGNNQYECLRNPKEHRFWINPRLKNIIHLNKYGDLSNWEYNARWKILDNGKYEEL